MSTWQDDDEVVTTYRTIQQIKSEFYQEGVKSMESKVFSLQEQLRASQALTERLMNERKEGK